MENVHKKLRSLLPAHVTVSSCVSAREALQHAQERVFRVIVIDLVIPDVNSIALMNQLRALQPHAVMVALALRTTNDIASEVRAQGFHDAMFKPFEAAAIDDFLSKYFDVKDELTVEGNVLLCATYKGKPEKLDRYFTRLGTLCREHLEKLASACHEDVILDLTHAPVRNDRLIRLVMDVDKAARSLGMVVTLVGTGELKKIFAAVVETASVPFCASVSEARGAAA
jgi:CheY-like chemotaxis protein